MVIKDVLLMEHYELFFTFSVRSYILYGKKWGAHCINYELIHIRMMIERLVELCEEHDFGYNFQTKRNDKPDMLSAFPHGQVICRSVTSKHMVAEEVIGESLKYLLRLICRLTFHFWDNSFFCSVHRAYFVEKVIELAGTTLTRKSPNNAHLIGNRPSVIIDDDGDDTACRCHTQTSDFFQTSVPPSNLDVFLCDTMSNIIRRCRRENV